MYSIHEEQYHAYYGNEGDYSDDYEHVDFAWKASSDFSEDGYCNDGAHDAPKYSLPMLCSTLLPLALAPTRRDEEKSRTNRC